MTKEQLATDTSLRDANFIIFTYLSQFDANGDRQMLQLNETTKRYVRPRYGYKKIEWKDGDLYDGTTTEKVFLDAVNCTKEHFTMKADPQYSDETVVATGYENWVGYPLLCENLTAKTSFQGSDQTFVSKLAQFELHKCRNEDLQPDEPRCADPADVDRFVERLYFDQYINMEKIDFEENKSAKKRPTRRIEKSIGGGLLRPDRL